MSKYSWDHTVHYVNDLEKAIDTFQKHGLFAKFGGKHTGKGTENALAYFGLNYLEFLTTYDRKLAKLQGNNGLVYSDSVNYLPNNEAFSRIALRVHGIEKIHQELLKKGLNVGQLENGIRKASKNVEIKWKIFTIAEKFHGVNYPFIIDWQVTDSERLAILEKSGLLNQHPNGDITTDRIIIESSFPEAVAAHWHDLFELKQIAPTLLQSNQQTIEFVKGNDVGIRELIYNHPNNTQFDFKIGNGRYRTN